MSLQRESLEEALRTLGAVLDARGVRYAILVVGGSNLLLLGLVDRPTGDLDVIALKEGEQYRKVVGLPGPLAQAAAEVADALGLPTGWLNDGPSSLMDFGLPGGWETRVEVRRYGALEVHLTSRFDQICFKLYAAVDRGPNDKHFADLVQLRPSAGELLEAARWTISHDPSVGFRGSLVQCLAHLGVEVGDDAL